MLTDARRFLRHGALAGLLPGRRDRDQRRRLQPARRRAARVARPEDEAMTASPRRRPMRGPSRSSTSTTCSSASGPTTGRSTPSTASPSSWRAGERLGLVGESGLRQERHQPRDHPPAAQAGRADRGRAGPVRRPGPRQARRVRDPRDPRPRHRDDLPGPDDQPEPRPDRRGADGRDDPGPQEDRQGRGPRPRHRAPGHGGHPAGRRSASRASRTSSRAACASA